MRGRDRYGLVLLDEDDTIFDFRACEEAALRNALADAGLPWSDRRKTYLTALAAVNTETLAAPPSIRDCAAPATVAPVVITSSIRRIRRATIC
jgi:hypothetical protein